MNETMDIYDVVELAKQNDPRAFVTLFQNTVQTQYPFVYCLSKKDTYLTQEILMEAYSLVFSEIHQLEDPSFFHVWLNEVVFRVAFGRLSGQEVPLTYVKETLPTKIERQERYRARLIAQKPAADHIIALAYYCGLSVREVGYVLGMNKQEVIEEYQLGKERYQGVLKINEENKALMKDFFDHQISSKDAHLLLNWIFATCGFEQVEISLEEPSQEEDTIAEFEEEIYEEAPKKKVKKTKAPKGKKEKEPTSVMTWVIRVVIVLLVIFFLIEPHVSVTPVENSDSSLPEYAIEVDSFLPISSVSAIQYNEEIKVEKKDSKHYIAYPTRNGAMKVTARLINTRKRSEIVNITNGDDKTPVLISQDSEDGFTTLTVEDRESGINYSKLEAKTPDGTIVQPKEVDEDAGMITYPFEDQPLEVCIEDNAGNRLRLVLKPVEKDDKADTKKDEKKPEEKKKQ